MTEGGIDAILGADALILGPETMGASVALMGMIIGIKRLKGHVEHKKEQKR